MKQSWGLEICRKIYNRLKVIKGVEVLGFEIYEGLDRLSNKKYRRKDIAKFNRDLKIYNANNKRESFNVKNGRMRRILGEWRGEMTTSEYFWMDLWGGLRIVNNKPQRHFDIGARLDGFIAHLLVAGIEVTMLDIRPVKGNIPGLKFIQTDATNLDNIEDNTIESLSAICSLEHFGLGRYGDPIDPEACFKAFKAIQRVVKPGGYVYIAVPVGKEHVEFNAHRIFFASTIVKEFNEMTLIEYSSVEENERIVTHKNIHELDEATVRMGLFIFKMCERERA